MSENELDLNYYTNEQPKPITHEMFNKLIKQRDQHKEENEQLKKEFKKLLNTRLESIENKTKSHIDDELEFAYKNWRAALSMGSSIAEEKFKADMENLRLREEIERLQNKLKD